MLYLQEVFKTYEKNGLKYGKNVFHFYFRYRQITSNTGTSKTVTSNSMLDNIELRVKRGVKWGQRGHSIPYHHQQSPPHPPTPPHGGSVSGPFQFSNLDNIDSMLPFFFSMLPYSMLIAFPLFYS